MTARPPIVLGADNLPQQLQASDSLVGAGSNVRFTASSTLPAVSLSGTTTTLNVSPVVAGNSLAAGESITVQPTAALPGGLNIAWWFVSAPNTVTLGLSSTVTLSVGTTTINWLVTAHR